MVKCQPYSFSSFITFYERLDNRHFQFANINIFKVEKIFKDLIHFHYMAKLASPLNLTGRVFQKLGRGFHAHNNLAFSFSQTNMWAVKKILQDLLHFYDMAIMAPLIRPELGTVNLRIIKIIIMHLVLIQLVRVERKRFQELIHFHYKTKLAPP